jgi:hypothetical protein
MRLKSLLLLFFLTACPEGFAQAPFCQLNGGVLEEKEPGRAMFKVYKEESESFADLHVFRAENMLFADKPGKWYFTDSRSLARFTIFWVPDRSQADFSVYFTETESFAGCPNSR